MDAEDKDDSASGRFVQVFFGPPSSKISAHSSTSRADAEPEPDDPRSSLTWRVPVTLLQVAGFKYTSKAVRSNSDELPSAPAIPNRKRHCKRRATQILETQQLRGIAFQ